MRILKSFLLLILILLINTFWNASADTTVFWVEDRYTDDLDYLGRYIVDYNVETGIEHSVLCPSNTTRIIMPKESAIVEVIDDTNGIIYQYDKGEFEFVRYLPQQSQVPGTVFSYNGNAIFTCTTESVLSLEENIDGEISEIELLINSTHLTAITAVNNRTAICLSRLSETGWTDSITEIDLDGHTHDSIKTMNLDGYSERIFSEFAIPILKDGILAFSCIRKYSNKADTSLIVDRYVRSLINPEQFTIDRICELPRLMVGGWAYTNSSCLFAVLAQKELWFGQELYYNAVILMDVDKGEYITIRKFDYGPQQWVENSFVVLVEQ